jgi:hypothetical protein
MALIQYLKVHAPAWTIDSVTRQVSARRGVVERDRFKRIGGLAGELNIDELIRRGRRRLAARALRVRSSIDSFTGLALIYKYLYNIS